MPADPTLLSRKQAASEALDTLFEISGLLNTGLNKFQLSTCVSLIESGANPEALAQVVKMLQAEAKKIEAQKETQQGESIEE